MSFYFSLSSFPLIPGNVGSSSYIYRSEELLSDTFASRANQLLQLKRILIEIGAFFVLLMRQSTA